MTESELSARAKLANALNPFPFDNLPTDIFDNLWYTIANDYGLTLSEFMALKNARSAHINLRYFSLYLIAFNSFSCSNLYCIFRTDSGMGKNLDSFRPYIIARFACRSERHYMVYHRQ
jgi:hypothetical protein